MWRKRSHVRAACVCVCVCDCVCANRWLGCTAGISPSLDRGSFTGCDIVVEAVIEDLALKKPLYDFVFFSLILLVLLNLSL